MKAIKTIIKDLIETLIEIRDANREWYLEEMYETYGEADVPPGSSFKDIKKYYDSLGGLK